MSLADRAFHIARDTLGRHVGRQDEYACAFGGLNFITFDRDGSTHVDPLKIETRTCAGTAEQSDVVLYRICSPFLDNSRGARRSHSCHTRGVAVEALHEVRVLADRMRVALESGDLNAFGSLLDEAWQAKKKVSTKISSLAHRSTL